MTTHARHTDPPDPTELRLTPAERRWAGGASIVLFAVALLVLFRPPTRTIESGVVRDGVRQATEYTTAVPDIAAVLSVLFAVAAALVLVAVIGRRFSSVTLPGIGLGAKAKAEDTTAEAADKAIAGADDGEEGSSGDPDRRLHAGLRSGAEDRLRADPEAEPDPEAWDRLDEWARDALVEWVNSGQDVLTSPIKQAVVDARKPPGRGNHPWFVSVKTDNGSVRVFRIATGRGGVRTTHDG